MWMCFPRVLIIFVILVYFGCLMELQHFYKFP